MGMVPIQGGRGVLSLPFLAERRKKNITLNQDGIPISIIITILIITICYNQRVTYTLSTSPCQQSSGALAETIAVLRMRSFPSSSSSLTQCDQVAWLNLDIRAFGENRPDNARIFVILPRFL